MADRAQLLNDPEEALRLALDGRQGILWSALPGIVTAVNLAKNTCTVQPSIMGVVQDESGVKNFVDLPVLGDVPILWPRAGGFALTLPLTVNDEVLVVFSSRCIDAWWQSGGIQKPMEARMHDLSDGFAIPGPASVPKALSGVSSTGAQLRNVAGTTYIELSADGKIKMVSPSGIELTGDVTITGGLTMTGIINLTGTMIASGAITALNFVAGALSFITHKHSGVTTGPGTSGGPVP